MFELTVRRTFSAAHAIVMRGVRERLHGHDWSVTLTVAGESIDSDGLLCDFHALEATLDEAVSPLHNRCLNELPPFDRVNPTAENVAEYVALEVARRLPRTVEVKRVDVGEAPGCVASYVANARSASPSIETKPGAPAAAATGAASEAPLGAVLAAASSKSESARSRRS